jgi:anionic cell wall polymer biosynthesis LytR-Cps2A-Psr (LCP) family protein
MLDSYADTDDGALDTHDDTSKIDPSSTALDAPLSPSERPSPALEANGKPPEGQEETLVRKRKRRKRKRKGLRITALVLAALIVIGALTVLMALNAIQSGEKAIKVDMEEVRVNFQEDATTDDEGKTVSYDGHSYALNENMVSLVFIGFDRSSSAEAGEPAGQSDSVILIAFDTQSGKITAISVPRDSMIATSEFVEGTFPSDQKAIQLCLLFSYGDGRETSCENTVTAVSRILYDIPITYYFALNESGIAVLNDAIGGVSLVPLQTIPNTNIVEGQSTVLFGRHAYNYVQWRDISVLDSPLDRQARQIQYVQAFAAQTLQLSEGSAGTLLDLFGIATDYSITNLGVNEFSYLASAALANDVTSLDMVTLSGEMVQGEVYAEYYLDEKAVYETILDVYYHRID